MKTSEQIQAILEELEEVKVVVRKKISNIINLQADNTKTSKDNELYANAFEILAKTEKRLNQEIEKLTINMTYTRKFAE